jgi:hypothetical protein
MFVGAGAALLATGGASVLVRKSYIDDYNASSCPGTGVPQPTQDCQDKLDRTQTWMTVAIISLIAGGASIVGGGVIIGTAPKATTAAAGLRFTCGPFGCVGQF